MNTRPDAAPPAPPTVRKMPKVGDDVHFFDDTRAQQYSRPGAGPYAAKVNLLDLGGVSLTIFAPGGILYAERVPHKSQLLADDKSRKKWWQWPHETHAKPPEPDKK